MAFLVLLEALSPVERAVFMLREVFGYGYPDVAAITGKTEVNCRQIFARARQRIAAGGQARDHAPSPARQAEGEELARRFFEAAAGGDMDALLGMLAPDVVIHGDGGGKAQAIGKPLAGRERVVRLLAGLFRRGRSLGTYVRLAWVNGQPGAVGVRRRRARVHRVRARRRRRRSPGDPRCRQPRQAPPYRTGV